MDARKLALALAVIAVLELGIIVYLGGEVGVLRERLENLVGSPVEVKLSETLIIHKDYPDEHVIRVVAVNMGLEDIKRLEIKLTWMYRGTPVHQDSIVIENLAARDFHIYEYRFYFDGPVDTVVYEWMGKRGTATFAQ